MKIKSRKIPGLIFASFLLLLFFVWLGSFLNFKCSLENLILRLELDSKKALAGENVSFDFHKPSQFIPLEGDTIYIEDDSAAPGETLWISVSFENSEISVAGFMAAIYYLDPSDTLILRPVTKTEVWENPPDPPETTVHVIQEKTDRIYEPHLDTMWVVWGARAFHRHIDTIKIVGSKFLSPYSITPGDGAVMRLKFVADSNATAGDTVRLGFLTENPELPPDPLPTWDDPTGLTTYVPSTRTGLFTIRAGPPNQCPVFAPMPSEFEVNEGATLEFDVTTSDPDGDSLTLFVDPLGPQYDFSFDTTIGDSLVTQTFSFSPVFGQAPDTIYVIFKVRDKYCVRTYTVSIEIIEMPQDLLIASSEEGGVPGSSGWMLPFVIINSIPIYGFQFTLRWDHTAVGIDSFAPTDVIEEFSLWTNLGDSLGKATVMVFGMANQTIPAGIETVLSAAFSVDQNATPGEVSLQLENAVEVVNPGDPSQPLGMVHGKFTVDLFGDANIDRTVDVADVVSVVAYILDNLDFTSRQFLAADVTANDTVNVADLVGLINIILGRWTEPSPSSYPEPMAIVRLDYDDLQPGATGEVKVLADLEVAVAGAQIKIDYDPEQLSFEAPRLSDWSDKFIAEYKDDKQGNLTVLLYNLSNDPISPGEGNILSLPVTVSPNVANNIKLEIDEIVLADQNAVEIPVDDGKASVPQAFELSQNYPNPFNPNTTIKFTLPAPKDDGTTLPTTLRIYNVLGEVVRTLVDEPMSPGVHHKIWDGRDYQGNQVASGIYFYRLRADRFSETKKMVLLK